MDKSCLVHKATFDGTKPKENLSLLSFVNESHFISLSLFLDGSKKYIFKILCLFYERLILEDVHSGTLVEVHMVFSLCK